MRFARFDSPSEVASGLAEGLISLVAARPDAVLALPSGNTPLPLYALLASAVAEGRADFSRATVFALDEYAGLGPEDPRSFAAYFRRHVFGPLRLAPGRAHVLAGAAGDRPAECRRYEAAIQEAGGLDLALLGIGANGHIAFNEPAGALHLRTAEVPLAPPAAAISPTGLTMGVGTLLSARAVWLTATGVAKAEAVARMANGLVDTGCPASLLGLHSDATIFLDAEAGALLGAGPGIA